MLISGKRNASISLLCVINALGTGGAEAMLYRLLTHLDRTRFRARVVTLIDTIEPFATKIRSLGIPVQTLGMRPGRPNPLYVLRLARWLRQDPPDVIQTWLYHADLVGGLAARLAGGIPVVWGIRHSDLSREGNPWLTLQTVKACARLSHWLPRRIVCNSEASRAVHAAAGYAAEKMMVIPNGLDLAMFRPDPAARESVKKELLEIRGESPLVGLIGRFHPHKDHQNFIQAAAILSRSRPDVHFLLCGRGITWDNPKLVRWIMEAGIGDRFRLLGDRDDVPRLMAGLDLAVSSSFGESFPNVIAEAMSCGVPCVATDVGDSAHIVGQIGRIVPPRDPRALAEAIEELLELNEEERCRLGAEARRRVQEHFDLPPMIAQFERLLWELGGREERESRNHPSQARQVTPAAAAIDRMP